MHDSLPNDKTINLSHIKSELENIRQWYKSIDTVYMDIERYLRINNKLLKELTTGS